MLPSFVNKLPFDSRGLPDERLIRERIRQWLVSEGVPPARFPVDDLGALALLLGWGADLTERAFAELARLIPPTGAGSRWSGFDLLSLAGSAQELGLLK
ncbi:MAG TPA: hypothetical protein VKJ47_14120 [Candidatus Binatia bacterium]|nr:hypothetical protein [Candidatus Binatia bacterium]